MMTFYRIFYHAILGLVCQTAPRPQPVDRLRQREISPRRPVSVCCIAEAIIAHMPSTLLHMRDACNPL